DKRTPLYEPQKAWGAKFTSFGGWELPVSYTDILKEHNAVRTSAGLFDVSHMGEILISGQNAVPFLNKLITNDVASIPPNKILYSPMCYENGTVIDDILIYKLSDNELLLIVNAGNIEKDEAWIRKHAPEDVTIENISERFVLLALQGPKSEEILKSIMDEDIELPSFYWFVETSILGMKVLVSRTGYTGEDGFEIYLYLPNDCADSEKLWNGILQAGKDLGVIPAGLGARDILRLEAALPLYGHELSDSILPLEARLKPFVKLDKEDDFIGKAALKAQVEQGIKRKLYGFEMIDRGIPRNGYNVTKDGVKIGYITSGGMLPTVGINGGLVLLEDLTLEKDDRIEIHIRKRVCEAKIVPLPFYKKKYKR
ncbi:MAG TPA: glycine cleavage system aminomethyltransferase GcvT, partial [Clostridia bacterium]|nr:glycine cleavage system aminomethyltransferase GcvT [Clostridia bacterium]